MKLIGKRIFPSGIKKSANQNRHKSKGRMISIQSYLYRHSHSSSKSSNNIEKKPILFEIYKINEFDQPVIIKTIYGTTDHDVKKPKVVDENVKYGTYVIEEEQDKIQEIQEKYWNKYEIGTQETKNKEIEKIRKITNWKLRILNDIYN